MGGGILDNILERGIGADQTEQVLDMLVVRLAQCLENGVESVALEF